MEKFTRIFKAFGKMVAELCQNAWKDVLKQYVEEQLKYRINMALLELRDYKNANIDEWEKSYEVKKTEVINALFDKIKLPLFLKPFKWLIKKTLSSTVDKQIQAGLKILDTLAI